jgi:hypothetical protein
MLLAAAGESNLNLTNLYVHLVVDNVFTHKTPEIQRWLLRHPMPGSSPTHLTDTEGRNEVSWSITVVIDSRIRARLEAIDESAWRTIFYPENPK